MSGFCYKVIRIVIEGIKKEENIQIFDNDKFRKIVSSIQFYLSLIIFKDRNYTIYLRTIKKEYCEVDLHNYSIFEIANQDTSYFYVKRNNKYCIIGLKDIELFLFNFLDRKNLKNIFSVNSYFRNLGKIYTKQKTLIDGNPLEIYFSLKDCEIEFFKYLSRCTLQYKEYSNQKGESKFLEKYVGIKVSYNNHINEHSFRFGKQIKIIFPDGKFREYSSSKNYSNTKIIYRIMKNYGNQIKTTKINKIKIFPISF